MSLTDGQNFNQSRARRLQGSIPASYTIFKVGDTYYAESCIPGGTDYSGDDAATVIQAVINTLTSEGHLFFKHGIYDLGTTGLTIPYTSLPFYVEGSGIFTDYETVAATRATHIIYSGDGSGISLTDVPVAVTNYAVMNFKNLCFHTGTNTNCNYMLYLPKTNKVYLDKVFIYAHGNSGTPNVGVYFGYGTGNACSWYDVIVMGRWATSIDQDAVYVSYYNLDLRGYRMHGLNASFANIFGGHTITTVNTADASIYLKGGNNTVIGLYDESSAVATKATFMPIVVDGTDRLADSPMLFPATAHISGCQASPYGRGLYRADGGGIIWDGGNIWGNYRMTGLASPYRQQWYHFRDDFDRNDVSSQWAESGTGSTSFLDDIEGGVVRLTSGATANNERQLTSIGGYDRFIYSKHPYLMARIRLGDATNNKMSGQVGLWKDNNNQIVIVFGHSTFTGFRIYCVKGGSTSYTVLKTGNDTNWHDINFKIVSDAMVWANVDGVPSQTQIITTDVPTDYMMPFIMVKTIENVAKTFDVDYYEVLQER